MRQKRPWEQHFIFFFCKMEHSIHVVLTWRVYEPWLLGVMAIWIRVGIETSKNLTYNDWNVQKRNIQRS